MFSVVIPLYNKEHTILRTLYSVLTQTYAEYEIIIVDDGSTDGSVALVEERIDDPRLRIIKQSNQGVSVARNRGVGEAKYAHIAFLDADDEWLPSYLAKASEAIKEFPDAGMYCTPALHRSILTGQGHFYIVPQYREKILEIDYFKDPKVLGGQTSGVVVSKAAFEDLRNNYEGQGFPPGLNLNEDWACFQSIALVYPTIYIGYSLSIRNTEVEGQLVNLDDGGLDMRLNKTPVYLNVTWRNYLQSKTSNKLFERFRAHEIRSTISYFVRKNYHPIHIRTFIGKLDSTYAQLLPNLEMKMYRHPNRFLILAYIAITKILFQTTK